MKLQTCLFVIIIFGFLVFSNCGSKNEDGPAACNSFWAVGAQEELATIFSAAIAYSTVQSTETCNAYKAAYQSYINILESYSDCALLTGSDRQEFEQALAEAEAELPDLCDE